MAAGQSAFAVEADVAVLDVLAGRLAVQEAERGAGHVRQLRTLLQLHAVYSAAGMDISTVAHAALMLGASEHRTNRLLAEALLLGPLPGALEAVECGLLTVEQGTTVVEQLTPLPLPTRLQVWARLQARLTTDADRGAVLPPARLAELLRRWLCEAEPTEATERRKRAEASRSLDYRLRADGLGDLFACGFTGPDLQAVVSRVRARAVPVGPDDHRTADQRRFDACKDLLLGRDPLPLDDVVGATCAAPAGCGRAACGCWPGSPAPCGAELLVHVTVGAALGVTDEPAELVGHGPLEPDLLEALLLASPRLRVVWTDAHGVPVAVGDRVVVPDRDDPASVRQALQDLAAQPPPPVLHPRHPRDHVAPTAAPPEPRPSDDASVARARAGGTLRPPVLPSVTPHDAYSLPGAAVSGIHPAGTSGGYRLPRRLRRLIEARAPRCEWPGCGARAIHCDAEHDLAWPQGPTCACNLGPCCRRHHRIKQLGWTKRRAVGAAVTWTSPDGRSWLSPSQHEPPAPATRPLTPVPTANAFDELTPGDLEELLWSLGLLPEDPDALELRSAEPAEDEPEQRDRLGDLIALGDTRWTLDLDDPSIWRDVPDHG